MKLKICGQTIMDKVYLTKRVRFSAMHSLESAHLSESENIRIFGKCFRTHGHDYHLEVTIKGKIDNQSGLSCDRDRFEKILKEEIIEKYTGVHLNDIFKSTTGEELVREFYILLKPKLEPLKLVSLRLQETAKNFFSYKENISDPRF